MPWRHHTATLLPWSHYSLQMKKWFPLKIRPSQMSLQTGEFIFNLHEAKDMGDGKQAAARILQGDRADPLRPVALCSAFSPEYAHHLHFSHRSHDPSPHSSKYIVRFKSVRAVVAGASGGVGRAIVQRLVTEGVPVIALVRNVSKSVRSITTLASLIHCVLMVFPGRFVWAGRQCFCVLLMYNIIKA